MTWVFIYFYLFNEFISQHKHKYNNMREEYCMANIGYNHLRLASTVK